MVFGGTQITQLGYHSIPDISDDVYDITCTFRGSASKYYEFIDITDDTAEGKNIEIVRIYDLRIEQ